MPFWPRNCWSNPMRKTALLILLCATFFLASCSADDPRNVTPLLSFTDDLGREVQVYSTDSVVSLYGSYADAWLLAGGELTGVTEDVQERGIDTGSAQIVGSVKEPSFEQVLALAPDFVILSADIAAQVDLGENLAQAGIPHAYFRVDHYLHYEAMMKVFHQILGRDDLYEQNVVSVIAGIEEVLDRAALREEAPDILLIRAYSTDAKAKGNDVLAGAVLEDLGCINIVEEYDSLLEDLSIEAIIEADPDFIFVTTMGSSSEAAIEALTEDLCSNPAWAGLSAVQEGRFVILPQDLFHYNPNARWAESYAYLQNILES